MRILLTHHLPLEGSESGRCTRGLAVGLVHAGHDVLCLVVEGRHPPSVEEEVFKIERVRCWPGDPQAELAFHLPSLAVQPLTRVRFEDLSDAQIVEYRNALRRRLDQCIADFDPHVIHCQHAWLFAHLALESGAPYLITAQGPELNLARNDARYGRFVEQAIENASRVLVHSRYVAQEIAALFPDGAHQIEQIPPAIDTEPSVSDRATLGLPPSDVPLVVYVGDLLPGEGVDTLLNAFSMLGPGVTTLAVCGSGPQRDELEAQARHQQLDNVRFFGDLPTGQRAGLLAAADLVVVGSGEGTSIRPVLEAFACGAPVIAAARGALSEIVDDRVGGLIEPNDHELLAGLLDRAFHENWKTKKGPQARQRFAERYSLAHSIPRHVAAYEAALVQRYGPDYSV